VNFAALALRALSAGRSGLPSLPNEKYATAYFSVRKRAGRTPKYGPSPLSSHCSSVQERLVKYASEALDTVEHLGLVLKNQNQATALLEHFGTVAAHAPSVQKRKLLKVHHIRTVNRLLAACAAGFLPVASYILAHIESTLSPGSGCLSWPLLPTRLQP
jgi:hypothetical protein